MEALEKQQINSSIMTPKHTKSVAKKGKKTPPVFKDYGLVQIRMQDLKGYRNLQATISHQQRIETHGDRLFALFGSQASELYN